MKKKFLALTLCLVLLLTQVATLSVFADATNPGYTLDETTKTYTVTTADGLLAVVAAINEGKLDYNVKLAADIDMKDKTWTPIGTDNNNADAETTDKPYKGTFDGDNHTISNLVCSNTAGEAALIALADAGCVVKNLKIVNADFAGATNAATIIAISRKGASGKITIENVHVRNAKISTTGTYSYAGGLIGQAGTSELVITNCTVNATVVSKGRAAGLIGGESFGSKLDIPGITIKNAIVVGSYTTDCSKASGAGGVLGYHSTIPLVLENVVVLADVHNTGHKDSPIGSLSMMHNKLHSTVTNFIGAHAFYGKVSDTTQGEPSLKNAYIYKLDATETELGLIGTEYTGEATIAINNLPTKWGEAKLPVISKKADLSAKAAEFFAGNTVITSSVIDELIGHEHAYTQEVAEATYLKAAPTCTEAAVYYKSCTCGHTNKDNNATFTSGTALGHTPSDKWSDDDDNHWHVCKTCLEEKTDVAAHTFGDWSVTREATEYREGERAKACTVCGHEVVESIPKKAPETEPVTEAATQAGEDETTATEEKKDGCGGSILGMGSFAVIALGAIALTKKKKND